MGKKSQACVCAGCAILVTTIIYTEHKPEQTASAFVIGAFWDDIRNFICNYLPNWFTDAFIKRLRREKAIYSCRAAFGHPAAAFGLSVIAPTHYKRCGYSYKPRICYGILYKQSGLSALIIPVL